MDFFSTPMLRDLLYPAREDRFTLPRIAGILEELDLELGGLELPGPGIPRAYRERFREDPHEIDLLRWHRFEEEEPRTFAGPYKLGVRRRR